MRAAPAVPTAVNSPASTNGQAGTTSVVIDVVPLDAKLDVPALSAEAPTPESLSTSFDALEPVVTTGRYDVAAQAHALVSMEKCFAFVRDRIRYEAYSGVLRDAEGTLAAGAGNALDRSRLLARLLQSQGIAVRFAAGTLPADQVQTLFAHMFDGFSPPRARSDIASQSPFFARVSRRADRDYPVIRTAIGSALSESAALARKQALDDIAQHFWVQANIGGQWQDLDTAFSGSTPGRSYAPVSRTVDVMPEDWYQRVAIRVLTERLVDGQLQLAPVMNVTRPVVGLAGRDVFLLHAPAPKETMGLGAGGTSGADRWTPLLLVGDDTEKGDAIDFGEVEGTSGFMDALGGGSSSTFVAEWIEFEVLQPDGRHDLTRRALVNRATEVWRATTPLDAGALKPLDRDDKGFVGPKALHHLLFSTGPQNLADYLASAMLVVMGDQSLFGQDAPLIDQLFPMAVRDQSSLVWTENVIVPGVNDTPNVRLYCDSPRIRVVSLAPGSDDTLTETLDLRRDWLPAIARTAADDAAAADRRVLFAALEGSLEHEDVAQYLTLLGGNPSHLESTSGALSTDGVVTITPADVDRLGTLTERPEVGARLRAALGSGGARLVVAPRAALARDPGAWWEISASGNVRPVSGANVNGSVGAVSAAAARAASGAAAPVTSSSAYNISSMTAREARLAQSRANLARFYKNLPARRAAQARQRGLEYGMLVALVVATIAFVAYLAYDYHKRAAQLAQQLDAIRAGQ